MNSIITPFLWFDDQAEVAAKFYTSIFKDSKITSITHYLESGKEITGKEPGSVMTVVFEIAGQQFTALNGGPLFKFNESISFQIDCATQEEIDYYWEKLSNGGDPNAQRCGWLKDKFGVSWQVVPADLQEIFGGGDRAKAERAFQAMLQMSKLDIATLKRAAEGE